MWMLYCYGQQDIQSCHISSKRYIFRGSCDKWHKIWHKRMWNNNFITSCLIYELDSGWNSAIGMICLRKYPFRISVCTSVHCLHFLCRVFIAFLFLGDSLKIRVENIMNNKWIKKCESTGLLELNWRIQKFRKLGN